MGWFLFLLNFLAGDSERKPKAARNGRSEDPSDLPFENLPFQGLKNPPKKVQTYFSSMKTARQPDHRAYPCSLWMRAVVKIRQLLDLDLYDKCKMQTWLLCEKVFVCKGYFLTKVTTGPSDIPLPALRTILL